SGRGLQAGEDKGWGVLKGAGGEIKEVPEVLKGGVQAGEGGRARGRGGSRRVAEVGTVRAGRRGGGRGSLPGFPAQCPPWLPQPPIQVYGLEGRYATALYSAASKQKKLEQVEKELTRPRFPAAPQEGGGSETAPLAGTCTACSWSWCLNGILGRNCSLGGVPREAVANPPLEIVEGVPVHSIFKVGFVMPGKPLASVTSLCDPKLSSVVMNPHTKSSVKQKAVNDALAREKIDLWASGEHPSSAIQLLAAGICLCWCFKPSVRGCFADLLAENGRLRYTPGIVSAFGKIMSAFRGEVVCTVTTAQVGWGALQPGSRDGSCSCAVLGLSLFQNTAVRTFLLEVSVFNVPLSPGDKKSALDLSQREMPPRDWEASQDQDYHKKELSQGERQRTLPMGVNCPKGQQTVSRELLPVWGKQLPGSICAGGMTEIIEKMDKENGTPILLSFPHQRRLLQWQKELFMVELPRGAPAQRTGREDIRCVPTYRLALHSCAR
ncbi:hypothetical protein DV515_00019410, partial [Chloebia gouldiae]